MKDFLAYCRERRRVAGLFALFCAVFAVTFALYGLPLEAAWYPTALCAAVGLLAAGVDFFRLRRLRRELARIRCLTGAELTHLPPARGAVDEEYQRILRLLIEEQTRRESDARRRYDDMVDYYTTWAHQIKTPIAAMRLTLQNEDTPLSRQLRRDLLRIEQYVEMVLMFLRLDSDSTDYLIREYPLDPIIRQAAKKYAGEFIARKLQFVYEPLDVTVLTDEKWLSFVIEQLLSNALKYTPSGSVSVTLEDSMTLCIRDSGMGIAPEDLPRIFEKGYTGCHGRSDKRASGIGLYLCRRVCTNLGHRIWAESAPDQGTAVYIDLSRRTLDVE